MHGKKGMLHAARCMLPCSGYNNNKDALLSQTWVIAKSHGSEGPYGPLRRTLHFRVTTPACLLV